MNIVTNKLSVHSRHLWRLTRCCSPGSTVLLWCVATHMRKHLHHWSLAPLLAGPAKTQITFYLIEQISYLNVFQRLSSPVCQSLQCTCSLNFNFEHVQPGLVFTRTAAARWSQHGGCGLTVNRLGTTQLCSSSGVTSSSGGSQRGQWAGAPRDALHPPPQGNPSTGRDSLALWSPWCWMSNLGDRIEGRSEAAIKGLK